MQLWSVHTVTVLLKENVDKVLISGFYIVETFIVNFGPVSETYAKVIHFKCKADQTSFD